MSRSRQPSASARRLNSRSSARPWTFRTSSPLEAAAEKIATDIPFGRISGPEEVAALVTFLASPLASFINGAHIPVDEAQRKAIMDQ